MAAHLIPGSTHLFACVPAGEVREEGSNLSQQFYPPKASTFKHYLHKPNSDHRSKAATACNLSCGVPSERANCLSLFLNALFGSLRQRGGGRHLRGSRSGGPHVSGR
eukprot:1195204-Prorocentrum_minimum.AAC.5